MATPLFKDKPILTEDITTWPKSPDRDQAGLGREKYAQVNIQKALHSNPSKKINLSEYNDILQNYEPDKNGLYKKDPIIALMNQAIEKDLFIEDDTFPPSIWEDGKTGVKKYSRIKECIQSPKMHIVDIENSTLFSMRSDDTNRIHPGNPLNSPTITDMGQKQLANCGFVAVIGSLTLHPQAHNLLFSMIYPAVYNPLGIYSIRLIVDSEVRYLLIDDQIPHENYSAMQNTTEFWYFLIEKAFAKLAGGYLKLSGGIEDYLGIESSSNLNINEKNKNCVWKDYFLYIFQNRKSTTYQGTGPITHLLVKSHAYSLIDAAEWSGFKLVRLHNPWNVANYTGPFSPESSKDWEIIPNAIQKELFEVDRFKKTTFWMPYEFYIRDIPKISTLYLNEKVPVYLKEIANLNPIQN